jgi:hypothetical protein
VPLGPRHRVCQLSIGDGDGFQGGFRGKFVGAARQLGARRRELAAGVGAEKLAEGRPASFGLLVVGRWIWLLVGWLVAGIGWAPWRHKAPLSHPPTDLNPASSTPSVTTSTPARCTTGSLGVTVLKALALTYSSVLDGQPAPPADDRPDDKSCRAAPRTGRSTWSATRMKRTRG